MAGEAGSIFEHFEVTLQGAGGSLGHGLGRQILVALLDPCCLMRAQVCPGDSGGGALVPAALPASTFCQVLSSARQ